MRELFSKRPHPYYIFAPDYRRTSAGIRVMHMLCDALMRSGHEAYVTGNVLNPALMTPYLTDEIVRLHRAQGLEPVVVYPEVVDGNPLNAGVVVRYLLNRPGFIEGSGKFGEEDILYAYSRDLLMPGIPDDRVMMMPPFDLTVFRLPENPEKRVPGKVCYYRGRRGEFHIDPSLLPADAVEITAQWPASWEEMADLFQQCETFYCCGASALGAEATLCGCLCVIILEEDAPRIGVHETQSDGVAWGLAPEELARARQTLPLVRDNWLKLEKAFWPALDHFIDVTQAAAEESIKNVGKRELLGWLKKRVLSDTQHRLISEHLEANTAPTIGVLVLDPEGDEKRLTKTIKSLSLEKNFYASVRIVALSPLELPESPEGAKLRFVQLHPGQTLVSIEQVVRQGGFDWFMLVEAGCEFISSGLLMAALDLIGAPDCRAAYGDEVVRQGPAMGLALRPDLNLDMLLSLPSGMARHWLFNSRVWADMGGFREGAGQAFELDYILRLIEDKGFDGLGHISEPLLIREATALRDEPDERAVIQRHLQTRGFQNAGVGSRLPGHYDLEYGAADGAPVSILIHTQGNLAKARRCMETLLEKTAYSAYEVLLLDQGGGDADLQDWLTGVGQLGTDSIRVLRFADSLSLAQVRNQAAEQARGDFLLWLDVGTAVLDADWLHQLVNHAARHEVGAVGAKLLAGDSSVRHAGLILGLNGPAGRVFTGQPLEAAGYLQRLVIDQNYTALSGKCLMLRKSLFQELGGFDETPELAPWTDVDLCLRLHGAGFLNVWTPRAPLLINEEAERPATPDQEDAMYARWLPLLARDPAYNRNLSLSRSGFDLESDTQLTWRPLSWRPLPVVLAHPADPWGCGNYRIMRPFNALKQEGLVDGMLSAGLLQVVDLERYDPDVILLQRQIGDDRLEAMRRIKQLSRAFKVYELDDYLPNLPIKNVHREHMPKDALKSLRRGLGFVDRFVVSTEALAEAFGGMHDDIRVIENCLPLEWWKGLSSQRRRGRKPRVGWAGGVSHTGDLELIADVVKELAQEVEWVFFGMCPEKIRPYVHELHNGVDIELYPQALARLDLDLAIAPVEQNLFNECKSNLRLLEYGACGFPVVCSDVRCYQGDLPVTRVKNRFRDWVEAIRTHINDLDASARMGDELRSEVLGGWMLEGERLQRWRKAWLPD